MATSSWNRYRFDPFFHTEVNVIALQTAFALLVLGLVGMSFSLLYRDVSHAIVSGIRAGIVSNAPSSLGPAIVGEIQQIKFENIVIFACFIVVATILFGYIVARVTLAPAKNALASQKQFIGNIAHELRTPLSVIKTNTEIALFDSGMTADLKQMLHSNIEELDRISEIINNLLSLSALVRPERAEFTTIDLSALVNEVAGKFADLAKRSEHQVVIRKSPGALVWGNMTGLEQIVGNLLKNSIQYTPRGGNIRMTVVSAPGNRVELIIQDSGIGIARKDLFRIFEPFYRAEESRSRAGGGSGLGLTIVSELIKMHGGKVSIRSAVGRGTTISVALPGIRRTFEVGGEERREGPHEIVVDFSKEAL